MRGLAGLNRSFLAVRGFFGYPVLETSYTAKGQGKRNEQEEEMAYRSIFWSLVQRLS